MGTLIRLVLGLCTLHLFSNSNTIVNATWRPWTTAKNSGTGTRKARSVNKPTPINCKLGSWSSWTSCDPCTDKMFSFRYLEKPSQFGGTECTETLWNAMLCPTSTRQCIVDDYCSESFTCKTTGRCVSQSLRCNGESDCDDSSDEDECTSLNLRNDKCSTLLPIPGAKIGTKGYNILTGDFVDHVLDSKYFGGKCEYVYNGEWRKFTYDAFCESLHYNEDEKNYRKPYNYHTYHFVAQAASEGTDDYYEDMASLLNARKSMSSFNGGFTLGISFVEVGLHGSQESSFLKNITKKKSENLGFVRLFSKVQTAHFKMRTNELMLNEDFYVSLTELPEQYDFGTYSRFLNSFGTHYVTEGTMGGTLEHIVAVNKTAMAESKMNGQEVGRCIGASLGLSIPIGDTVALQPKLSGQHCRKDGSFLGVANSDSAIVEDTDTLVKGGITDSSAGLQVVRTPEMYQKWGASLKYNPALIEFEIMPIYELVRLSTVADHLGARVANLQLALDEYLQQFDACRCAPCRNSGIPVLSGTSCKCICKSGFQGEACEETQRRDAKTDGLWSCWGSWSACTSRRKTRTRVCDNPPPERGGITCLGSASQTSHC